MPNSFFLKYMPNTHFKWLILLFDMLLGIIAFLFANFILNEFKLLIDNKFLSNIPYIFLARGISYLIFETHISKTKYTNIKDLISIFVAVSFGSILIFVSNLVNIHYFNVANALSNSIIFTDFLCTLFALTSYRVITKTIYYQYMRSGDKTVKNALIYGIEAKDLLVKKFIEKNIHRINIVAFIDDNIKNKGKTLENLPVFHTSELDEVIEDLNISHLLVPKQRGEQVNKTILNKDSRFRLSLVEFPDLIMNIVKFYPKDKLSAEINKDETNFKDQILLN